MRPRPARWPRVGVTSADSVGESSPTGSPSRRSFTTSPVLCAKALLASLDSQARSGDGDGFARHDPVEGGAVGGGVGQVAEDAAVRADRDGVLSCRILVPRGLPRLGEAFAVPPAHHRRITLVAVPARGRTLVRRPPVPPANESTRRAGVSEAGVGHGGILGSDRGRGFAGGGSTPRSGFARPVAGDPLQRLAEQRPQVLGVAGIDGGGILEDIEQTAESGTARRSGHMHHGKRPGLLTVVPIRASTPV